MRGGGGGSPRTGDALCGSAHRSRGAVAPGSPRGDRGEGCQCSWRAWCGAAGTHGTVDMQGHTYLLWPLPTVIPRGTVSGQILVPPALGQLTPHCSCPPVVSSPSMSSEAKAGTMRWASGLGFSLRGRSGAGLLWWVGRVWPEGICVELGGFLVTVRFIPLPQKVGLGLSPKGALMSHPPLQPSLSSDQPDLLPCRPTPQAPFCPRSFALAVPATGSHAPLLTWLGPYLPSAARQTWCPGRGPPLTLSRAGAPCHTPLFIVSFETLVSPSPLPPPPPAVAPGLVVPLLACLPPDCEPQKGREVYLLCSSCVF